MKKVLIVGASSFIGANLAKYLQAEYRVYGTYASHRPRIDNVPTFRFLLEKEAPIHAFVKFLKPSVVVYCAGLVDEKHCEQDPNLAIFINAVCAFHFAESVERLGGRFIYLSTSKVFPGEKGPYSDEDKPFAMGGYGNSKLRAEEQLAILENAFTLRLGTVFGLGGLRQRSILNQALKTLWASNPTPLVSDELRTFTPVSDVCKAIKVLIEADLNYAAIYNLGGKEALSYYTFFKRLAFTFGASPSHFVPTKGVDLHPPGTTQHVDLTLKGSLLKETFGFECQDLSLNLEALKKNLDEGHF